VKEDSSHFGETVIFDGSSGPGHGPDGFEGRARIPGELLGLVIDAAEECPGECIYVEV
jgi:ferredoxin